VKIILDAASKAPSGGNVQPARYLVIRDPEKIRAFGELYHEAWWAKRRDTVGWKTVEDIPPEESGYLAAARLADEIRDAPLVILVFGIVRDFDHSIFPGVQNLLLAARAGRTFRWGDLLSRIRRSFLPD
jgi:nitroreductase